MKFYPEEVVQKARELKKKGVSAEKIAQRLEVGSSRTILRWCSDLPSDNAYHRQAEKRKKKAKKRGKQSVEKLNLTQQRAKIWASIIYWCEGANYPPSNFISFANSDVNLMETFLKLFRVGFQPEEDKIKARLQLHTTHDKEKMTSFWSKILDIPKSQFHEPTITKPKKKMKRKGYKGTCTVRYYDVYLLLEMMGVYESFSERLVN